MLVKEMFTDGKDEQERYNCSKENTKASVNQQDINI